MTHPITPPLELLKHWEDQHFDEGENYDVMLIQAFQAGADQELEACCEWLGKKVLLQHQSDVVPALRTARRPKAPSLKEQALADLHEIYIEQPIPAGDSRFNRIRRALEELPDD